MPSEQSEFSNFASIDSVNKQSKKSIEGYLNEKPIVEAKQKTSGDISTQENKLTKQMELWLTGTGTPADFTRCGPSQVFRIGEDIIVIDTGNGILDKLLEIGIEIEDVTYIFITHHHIDHIIDLSKLLIFPWVQGGGKPYNAPTVVGPRGTLEYVNRLFAAFDYDIRVRIPHNYNTMAVAPDVVEIDDGDSIKGLGWEVKAFRVDHFPVDEAFGYSVETDSQKVVISGDTKPSENVIKYAQNADILIHEVIFEGFGFPEYHTLSTDVGKVAKLAKAKKLVLTHLLPGNLEDQQWVDHAKKSYSGPIIVGQDLLKLL